MAERSFMTIDLHDFQHRKDVIIDGLMKASKEEGFFYVINHGIQQDDIQEMFETGKQFFSLTDATKNKYLLDVPRNAGYENFAQLRPQTGLPDLKESMQLAFHHIPDLWPKEQDAPGFQQKVQRFMLKCNEVSQQLLECFALGLGFPEDFFTRCHDITQPDCLNSLRFHHYFDLRNTLFDANRTTTRETTTTLGNRYAFAAVDADDIQDYYRAGPHTDPDTLTLLFQNNPGHDALEACRGRTDVTKFVQGSDWRPLCPQKNELVCNIGDMLMLWSDDILKSNFHRVKRPSIDSDLSSRYTIAYFTQANKSAIIQGRLKYTEPLTAGDFLRQAMERNHQRVKMLIDKRTLRKRCQRQQVEEKSQHQENSQTHLHNQHHQRRRQHLHLEAPSTATSTSSGSASFSSPHTTIVEPVLAI